MNYFQFHIGDYAKHTAHLSPMEDLAYRRLLEFYYDSETPIPTAIPLVSRRLRMDAETIQVVLSEFFVLTEKGWTNTRADKEIAAYHAFLEKQKANGIKGGRPPKNPKEPTDNPSLTQNNPNHEPLPTTQQPITIKQEKAERTARATRLPDDFTPDFDFAVSVGIQNTLEEANKFRDYWRAQPGQKGVKLDWPATWRNWCRNAKPSFSKSGHVNKQEALEASNRAVVQRLLAKEAQHAQQ